MFARWIKPLLSATALCIAASAASAAWQPTQPVTLVVPYTPGTGIDLIARQLSAHLPGALGQPVIVENVAGASGNIRKRTGGTGQARWPHAAGPGQHPRHEQEPVQDLVV